MTRDQRTMRELAEEALVRDVGDRIGYGRTMQLAEKLWGQHMERWGTPGGQHTTGPAAALMVPCGCVGTKRAPCDWCCGAMRVTKRVRAAQRCLAVAAVREGLPVLRTCGDCAHNVDGRCMADHDAAPPEDRDHRGYAIAPSDPDTGDYLAPPSWCPLRRKDP